MELVELVGGTSVVEAPGWWLEGVPRHDGLGGGGRGGACWWLDPSRGSCMALLGSYSQGLGCGRGCGSLLPTPRLCLLPLRTHLCGLERAGFQSTHDAH